MLAKLDMILVLVGIWRMMENSLLEIVPEISWFGMEPS